MRDLKPSPEQFVDHRLAETQMPDYEELVANTPPSHLARVDLKNLTLDEFATTAGMDRHMRSVKVSFTDDDGGQCEVVFTPEQGGQRSYIAVSATEKDSADFATFLQKVSDATGATRGNEMVTTNEGLSAKLPLRIVDEASSYIPGMYVMDMIGELFESALDMVKAERPSYRTVTEAIGRLVSADQIGDVRISGVYENVPVAAAVDARFPIDKTSVQYPSQK